MASYAEKPDAQSPTSIRHQANDMLQDVKSEVGHEVRRIHTGKEPVDPSQSDHVVRRHVAGLSITFFIVILLVLLVVIGGIAIYTHANH
jgi:hypothetical protein